LLGSGVRAISRQHRRHDSLLTVRLPKALAAKGGVIPITAE
jgi:hypothetical protein